MKKSGLLILGVVFGFALSGPEKALAQKEIFLDKKCNRCHSISAAGIERKGESEGSDETVAQPPDLSHVGKYHDVAFIKGFVTKTTDHVAHEGVAATGKHPMKFKGSDDELDKVATWLASLK